MKKLLSDMNMSELEDLVTSLGEAKFRAKQILKEVADGRDIENMTSLSKALRQKLMDVSDASGVKIIEKLVSRDGTEKYLYSLRDGHIIEGVFMKYKYGNTLCVSTQVGCRMGCNFCASGIGGLVRNLSAGEIIGQIVEVNKLHGGTLDDRKVTNVVLMGSGEPFDNYTNVYRFLELCRDVYKISMRNVSLSTSGLIEGIYKLADSELHPTLTISLHATTDEKRSEIMPVNRAYNIQKLIEASRYYFDKTGRRVVFEYAMMEGINDTEEDAKRLSKLLKGFPTHLNLIPLNYVKEKNILPTSKDGVTAFLDRLTRLGVSATKRRTMGADISGACGQLRRKYLGGN